MTNFEILTVILFAFLFVEVSVSIKHLFEKSKGTFILKKEKQSYQAIIHSSFDQMAIGLIVNYEQGFFISLYIFNLHFCFIYIKKKLRQPVILKPTIGIVEWMNNGIEKLQEIGELSELYFRPLEQGYELKDVDIALKHFRDLGSSAYWIEHRQEIVLNIKLN